MGKKTGMLPARGTPLSAAISRDGTVKDGKPASGWFLRLLAPLLLTTALALPAVADTGTRTSSFAYDPATGLLTEEKIEPGNAVLTLTTTYAYDAFGNKLSATVSGQGVTSRASSSTYDVRGQFATANTNALGQSDTFVTDPKLGVVTSQTGPNGLTTIWQFDGFGRKTLETRSDGTRTSWTYLYCSGVNGGTQTCPVLGAYAIEERSLAADGVTPNGPLNKSFYDRLNRIIAVDTQGFDGATIRTEMKYDAAGRQTHASKPYFLSGGTVRWVISTYDALGRPLTVKQPDESESTFAYHGLTTSETNALNQTKTTVKNGRGLTISVTDAMSGVVQYAYDAFDNLTAVTDASGNVSTMTYDIRGRKLASDDPDMGEWTYGYNAFGELTSQTDAKSQTTTLTYDLLGRVTERVEPSLTSNWVYGTSSVDKNVGKLVSATTSAGYQRTHTYDSQGRPSGTSITIDGVTSSFLTSYDAHSRVSQITYPSGLTVVHSYTALGYLRQLHDPLGPVFWTADQYDAEMNLLQQTTGAVMTQQSFDPLTSFLEGISAGATGTVANFEYSYDTVGNLLTRSDANQSIHESFEYDDLNRVSEYQVAGGTAKSVTYDLTGNILGKSDVGTYTYAAPGSALPHAVQSIAGTLSASYIYDANGNMISGAGRTLTWTSFNMPATIAQGAYTVGFAYNGEHERIKQTSGSQTTYYLNGAGVMSEKVVDAGVARWNDYLSAGGKMIGVRVTVDGGPAQHRYFVGDHLGSVSVITDELGNVVERLSFDPWGKRRIEAGWLDDPINIVVGLNTTRGFTGHEHLDTVGLVHMNARVYDPLIGRFLSADPTIQDPLDGQTLNRYHYARNNPLAYVDPTGYGFFSFFKNIFKKAFHFLFKTALGRSLLAIAAVVSFQTWVIAGTVLEGTIGAAIIGGAIGGAISSGSLEGALFGAVSAAAFYGVGSITGMHGAGLEAYSNPGALAANVAGHAAIGCGMAASQGSKCGPSALAGAMTAFAGPAISGMGRVGGTITSAALGGGTAVVGGGKFQNGAITGAFGYLYNETAYEIGKAGEDAWARSVVEGGGTVEGRNLKYVVVDEAGRAIYDGGKPITGEIDGLGRDRFGFWEVAEVKNGRYARFSQGQLDRLAAIASGNVRFYGANARLAGYEGMTLVRMTQGLWGGFKFIAGPAGAPRATRQYLRYMLGRGGGDD